MTDVAVATGHATARLQNGRGGGGGHVKFYPNDRGGGAEKVLAMLFSGSFYTIARSFSHIEGAAQKVSTL